MVLTAKGIRVIDASLPRLQRLDLVVDSRQTQAAKDLGRRRPHLGSGIVCYSDYNFKGHINLKVVTQDGNEIFFKCLVLTPLGKLMHAFCQRQGVALPSVRFLFDGTRINEHQMPIDLDMRDGDVVDVMVEQQG
eukprot:6586273-Prymnesium_polylepis.1